MIAHCPKKCYHVMDRKESLSTVSGSIEKILVYALQKILNISFVSWVVDDGVLNLLKLVTYKYVMWVYY